MFSRNIGICLPSILLASHIRRQLTIFSVITASVSKPHTHVNCCTLLLLLKALQLQGSFGLLLLELGLMACFIVGVIHLSILLFTSVTFQFIISSSSSSSSPPPPPSPSSSSSPSPPPPSSPPSSPSPSYSPSSSSSSSPPPPPSPSSHSPSYSPSCSSSSPPPPPSCSSSFSSPSSSSSSSLQFIPKYFLNYLFMIHCY